MRGFNRIRWGACQWAVVSVYCSYGRFLLCFQVFTWIYKTSRKRISQSASFASTVTWTVNTNCYHRSRDTDRWRGSTNSIWHLTPDQMYIEGKMFLCWLCICESLNSFSLSIGPCPANDLKNNQSNKRCEVSDRRIQTMSCHPISIQQTSPHQWQPSWLSQAVSYS